MAPLLAYNLTDRLFVDYITGNDPTRAQAHTVMFRFPVDTSATTDEMQAKAYAIINARGVAAFRIGWTVTGVRYSAGGNTFSVPLVIIPTLDAFVGTGTYTDWVLSAEALEERFLGRSPLTGVRTSFSFYGRSLNSIQDFRQEGAGGAVANVIAVLQGATVPLVVAGDNTVPTWYPYADLNYNSHWERELRV